MIGARAEIGMGLELARLIEFRRIANPKGNLTPIEGATDVPFDIARVYYLYDVPGGEVRGGHAHRNIHQVIIAASGSFDVVLDDGVKRARYMLNRSYYGLYVPKMVWRELDNFSSGSVCLVLASDHYEEADYIRDLHQFREVVRAAV
jgi:oxalate decarboxylase/phosphoglucose isomerase-like protein (cupin superfamily)